MRSGRPRAPRLVKVLTLLCGKFVLDAFEQQL